jgi:uncharacterized protein (UPF0276 family)
VGASDPGRALGVGLIYAQPLAPIFDDQHPSITVIELEPQTLWEKVRVDGQWCYRPNVELTERVAAYPVAKLMHGIGQPVGGTVADPVDHLRLLRSTAELLDAEWVSEHLSYNRVEVEGQVVDAGFLLPPPQTTAGVHVAAQNIADYRNAIGRPVAFETGANYLRPQTQEMQDGDYWREVAEQADCGLLLDLHNLWCNELNGRAPVREVLDRLPLDRVWEVHLAGGMEMQGYWLDAHSGVVPEPLIDLTAQVIPRLPNLGALMFELLAEHVEAVGLDGVDRQLCALGELWELRPPTAWTGPPLPSALVAPATAHEVAEVRSWEVALYDSITGRQSTPDATTPLRDPGVGVYRELIADFRRGSLAQAARYTVTMLLLGLGRAETNELLDGYLATVPAQVYRALEVERFCRFLEGRSDVLRRVGHLDEVVSFERALVRATVLGEDSLVQWRADPTAVLGALDRGTLPQNLPSVRTAMRVTA